jgi:hypothetical protein
MPLLASAQGFEFGLNGGLAFHSVPINNTYTYNDKPKLSGAGSFKGDLVLPHLQIGVGVEMLNLIETNYDNAAYNFKTYNYLAKPLVNPYLFVNKTYYGGAGYFYIGAMAGAVIAKVGVNTFQYGTGGAVTSYSTAYNSVTGYTGGVQLGFTARLFGPVSFNGEAAMRYTSFDYEVPNGTQADHPYRYHLFYFPMTVGLRWHIFSGEEKQPKEKKDKMQSGYDKHQSF